MWSYLEPLFLKSKEVQEELPEDAARFKHIDNDVKKLLKEARLTRFILHACNKEGLYDLLEWLKYGLSRCKNSLNDLLDVEEIDFPRYVKLYVVDPFVGGTSNFHFQMSPASKRAWNMLGVLFGI